VAIRDTRLVRRPDPAAPEGFDVVVETFPGAPLLWARFYELGTDRPIFSGRDGVVKGRLDEIELKRRVHYSWLGPYATELLDRDYPAWKARLGSGRPGYGSGLTGFSVRCGAGWSWPACFFTPFR
jgi:Pectic acid lyase